MQTQFNKISFEGQNVFIGIDVHLKSWKVTVMTENNLQKTFSQNPNAETLRNYLDNNFPKGKYKSAYEAGFCGFSVHRSLEQFGIENIVVSPADIPTTDKERKQKEDGRDSRKIARSLKNGELKGIYIPTQAVEELRSLVRYRKTLVKEISRHKIRLKSFLYCNGVIIPELQQQASRYWSGSFTSWLLTINFTTEYNKSVLQGTLSTVKHLKGELLTVYRLLRQIERDSPYSSKIKLLRSVPGIGLIVAVTLLSELGNFGRFKNFDQLCSFVGLVPRTNSSGENEKVGRITQRANKQLRNILVESAWVASRTDPVLSMCYLELIKRMKPTEAIVRIAKKLLNRIRYVMNNEKEYVQSVVQ